MIEKIIGSLWKEMLWKIHWKFWKDFKRNSAKMWSCLLQNQNPTTNRKKSQQKKRNRSIFKFFCDSYVIILVLFFKKILSYLLVHFRSVTLFLFFLIGVSRLKWKLWCSRCICIAKVVQVMSRERLRKWKVKYSYSLLYECFPSKTWHCKMLNSCKAKFKSTIIPVSEYILV